MVDFKKLLSNKKIRLYSIGAISTIAISGTIIGVTIGVVGNKKSDKNSEKGNSKGEGKNKNSSQKPEAPSNQKPTTNQKSNDNNENTKTTTTKKTNDGVTQNSIRNNNPKGEGKKRGKQRDLPPETSGAVDIPQLIEKLKTTNPLTLNGLKSALEEFRVKVNISGGTSYNDVKIGDKHGNMSAFVKAWNDLSENERSKLDLDKITQMFEDPDASEYEKGFNIPHQVKSIFLDPTAAPHPSKKNHKKHGRRH